MILELDGGIRVTIPPGRVRHMLVLLAQNQVEIDAVERGRVELHFGTGRNRVTIDVVSQPPPERITLRGDRDCRV